VNRFADYWDFEKNKRGDRLKNNTADPSHFLKDCAPNCPARLAHAIATQTHCDTKAMARAKIPSATEMKVFFANDV